MATARVERLRARALARPATALASDEMRYLYARAYEAHAGEAVLTRRQTLARASVLERMTPVIGEDELIVGRQCFERALTDDERDFLSNAEAFMPARSGQDSHMALDYKKLLSLGTTGVRAEIEARMAALDTTARPRELKKRVFYENCLIMLGAVETLAQNYARACKREALTVGQGLCPCRRAQELNQIAETLSNVPANPARTFREALQSIQILTFHLEGLYQAGRPDQYLLPYYEADIRAGRLDEESALELIDCFSILYTMTVPPGLAVGYMLGGRDERGETVENALTRLFLRSIFDTRLAYPGVGLCVTERTSDDILTLAARALGEGLTHPALFNDDVIVAGLEKLGLPFEHAVSYIHSTCVEITPVARSGVWVASPYHNLVKPLIDIVREHAEDTDITFDAMYAMYKQRLTSDVRARADEQNLLMMNRALTYSNPLVSCFVDDCIARGLDVDDGGALYAYRTPSFVGLANLVDSLAALKKIVFEDGACALKDMADAIRSDFEGAQNLRAFIESRAPRYGNDDAYADEIARDVALFLPTTLNGLTTYMGQPLAPSMFCWIMHERLGRETPASPDGRRAGFPLGDGSGPAQGREKQGPTASILSSTSWDHTPYTGGIAVNLKLNKRFFEGDGINKLTGLIRAFMRRGGFELQLNVVDRATLEDALVHPESHGDLVVRIGGYSDYFTKLNPQMQREVIMRTEHGGD